MARPLHHSRRLPDALRRALTALDEADSAEAWQQAAEAHDQATGLDAWRDADDDEHYDATLLRGELTRLRRLRASGEGAELASFLTESVSRHLSDLTAPELYTWALSGTKRLVEDYLAEVELCLTWLCDTPIPGLSAADKLARFERAWRVYGRSALMLSGGATWGFFHIGVIKALFEANLLPHILSGSSTGAMVAAGIGARSDAELAELFANPDQMRLDGLKPVGLRAALSQRAWLDPDRLLEVLHHNVGELTFAEAFARSGRALNISVSPTRTRQKPRVLSHLTAPHVLVASAALASSALPGLFPPVVLEQRDSRGRRVPYIPTERWVDGSIYGDLPKLRLARLHNVNHFIASQTNPHVVPFVWHQGRRGLWSTTVALTGAALRTQGAYAAELASRATRRSRGPLGQLADRAQALVSQDYRGDIDIHPRFRWDLLAKIAVNPSPADLQIFISEGERATWPQLAMIRDQTRIGSAFRECVARLRAE